MTARSQTGLWAAAAAGSIALHVAAGMILYAMPMPDGPKTVRTEINIAAVSTGDSQVRHSRKRHGRQSGGQCDRGAPVGVGGARGRKHCPRANARAPHRPTPGRRTKAPRLSPCMPSLRCPTRRRIRSNLRKRKRRPNRRQREKQHSGPRRRSRPAKLRCLQQWRRQSRQRHPPRPPSLGPPPRRRP